MAIALSNPWYESPYVVEASWYESPIVIVPDGTAWWAGEKSHYIDWKRDLRKDAIEGYKETWNWYEYDREIERALTR